MKPIRLIFAVSALVLSTCAVAESDSPWLPIPGQFSLGASHTQQSGKDAYIGATKIPISMVTGGSASDYQRSTTILRFSYGINDALALDATIGYGDVKVGAADKSSGRIDSVVGLNYRVLDEFELPSAPTVTLRVAAIVAGNYDGKRLAAVGNAQNGFEVAAIIGKHFTPAFSLWAELGIQDRSGKVPNATFFELNARYRFAPGWSASVGYTDKKYGGSLDIGGPGFSPDRFQEVRAERSLAKVGIAYAIAGNQGLALSVGQALSGRNTVKDDQIISLAYTFAF
jgi:hypothetical protein